ncbi:MAG: hypothetical protein WAQ25_03605 [Candidatus Saccharimonas sp.]
MTALHTAQITFMRHGEKSDDGSLTGTGFEQARRTGQATTHLEGGAIMLFHSGVGRVKDTVRTMAAHLHLGPGETGDYELGKNIVDYVAPNLHYLIDPTQKGDYFAHWDDIELNEGSIRHRMIEFLTVNDPDPGFGFSAEKMARNIAQMIGIQVRFANMTDITQKVQFINGTHEPVIMAFLYYFINDFAPTDPAAFLDTIGGSIEYTESFDIATWHSSPTDFVVELEFRDTRYPIDLDRLRQFAYGK